MSDGEAASPVPDSAEITNDIQLEGWLHKRSGKNRRWQKRWFILGSDALTYYKEKDKNVAGWVNLKGTESVLNTSFINRRENCFSIIPATVGDRVFHMSAATKVCARAHAACLHTHVFTHTPGCARRRKQSSGLTCWCKL